MILRRAVQVLCALGCAGGLVTMGVGMVGRARVLAADGRPRPAPLAFPAGTTTVDRPDMPAVAYAAFEVDGLEVSVAEYDACARAGACTLYATVGKPGVGLKYRHFASADCRGGRSDRADESMNCVDREDAEAYCKWVGKRLPTREEWWVAIGAKHREQGGALHRTATPALRQEWTSSIAQRVTPAPWVRMWWVGTWQLRSDPNHEGHFKARMGIVRDSFRWQDLGFRCAR